MYICHAFLTPEDDKSTQNLYISQQYLIRYLVPCKYIFLVDLVNLILTII